MRSVALIVASAAFVAVVGWWIAGVTYPSHEDVRAAAHALVPPDATSISVWEIDGLEWLVGPYAAYGDFEGGASNRLKLVQRVQELARAEGWALQPPIEHPGAVELQVSQGVMVGTITVFGPPSTRTLGGRVRLLYAEDVDWRMPVGAAAGGALGGALGWLVVRGRQKRPKSSG